MWQVEYFTRQNGHQPAAEWLDGLDVKLRMNAYSKIGKLIEHGLELLGTEMLKPIAGDDKDLFELRAGQCRIATYCDRSKTFVLLNGWLKRSGRQPHDIEQARRLLHEYLVGEGE